MKPGLDWILGVAHAVSGWDGAVGYVTAPSPAVLPVMALGALMIMLWQGRARWSGLVPLAVSALMWVQTDRPPVLIASDGGLVGVLTDSGRALSKVRGSGFVAEVWLENDGDGADQPAAAERWPGPPDRIAEYPLASGTLRHVQGKRAAATLNGCRAGDVIVSTVALAGDWPCTLFDPDTLRSSGAVALWPGAERVTMTTARDLAGHRLWHGPERSLPLRLAARAAQAAQ